MNVNAHPQFEEDFELYALGALEGEERQVLEAHLGECLACRERLAQAQGRISVLGWTATIEAPPTPRKGKLMEAVQGLGADKTFGAEQRPPKRPIPWLRWAPALLAAVLLLLVIVGATMIVRLRNENGDLRSRIETLRASLEQQKAVADRARAVFYVLSTSDTVRVTLLQGAAHPAPEGKAFYEPRSGGLVFYSANLPTLPRNQTYQLWLIPARGNPISAGLFGTDAKGNGGVFLPPLPAGVTPKAFAVTIEPAGGKIQPTGPKVLVGAVS